MTSRQKEFRLSTKSTPSATSYRSEPVYAARANQLPLGNAPPIPLISAYPELSSSNQRAISRPEIEPSFPLCEISTPESTSESSLQPTIGVPRNTNFVTQSGPQSSVSRGQSVSEYPTRGLKLPQEQPALVIRRGPEGTPEVFGPYVGMTEHRHSALDRQIGGSHYKDFEIQPIEFIHKNGIGFIVGNVIKYVCRYKAKGGTTDLEKAKHYIDMLIEQERAESNE